MSNSESAGLVNAIIDHIMKALSRGEAVKLPGFGTFSIQCKKKRMGRNPKTGKAVPIAERHVVSFKPSSKLKRRVELKQSVELKQRVEIKHHA